MQLRKRHPKPSPTRPFPPYLETPEQTLARLDREQAAYVARHVSRR
jgi:hypothetical protein